MYTKEHDKTMAFTYPDKSTHPDLLTSWASQHGVALHPSGLVMADSPFDSHKIASSFPSMIEKINSAQGDGKHIIILPGSYDLAHAGHLSFVIQATNRYLSQNQNISRGELFVAMLVDDDGLIREVKKRSEEHTS